MKLLIFGPQGAGKGTYAELIVKKFEIPHISPGNLFRLMESSNPLYKQVRELIDNGQVVSDEITNEMIKNRLLECDAKDGFILDGYPRNTEQAKALDNTLSQISESKINFAVFVEIPEEESIKRLSSRRSCRCGAVYNTITKPSKTEGKCDVCGEELYVREDDTPEAISARLKYYKEQTAPLKKYYEEKGILKIVDGVGSIESVFNRILESLQ